MTIATGSRHAHALHGRGAPALVRPVRAVPRIPTPAVPRVPAGRRAVLGAAWAALWTLAWALALGLFASRAHAAPLSIAVSDGPVSLPIYVAQARGFFQAEGVDVRLADCRSGRDCYRLLGEGRVDAATAAELLVATGGASPPDAVIVATLSASSYQIKIVARRSEGIAEAPQMRGKRIGTVAGTSAQYFLDNWLVFNDLDPRTVTVVPLAPERLADALVRRQVDAIAVWEPLAASAAAALDGDAVTFASPRIYTQHFNLVVARPLLAARGAEVEHLLKALVDAQRFIAAQPVEAQAILAARLHVSPAQAATWTADQDYRIRLDQSLVTTMQSQRRWAARAGLGDGGGADLMRAIDPRPLRRAEPGAVGLVH